MRYAKDIDQELVDYKLKVWRAALKRKADPIYNGSTEHAQIVIETLIENARRNLNILSGGLNDSVYGCVGTVGAFAEFLDQKDSSARILIEKDRGDWVGHPFMDLAKNDDRVEIRILDSDKSNWFKFHFSTADGDSYRFEPDKRKHSAVAAFGDHDITEHLDGLFNELWGLASPLQSSTNGPASEIA